jgi:hypothetical protein
MKLEESPVFARMKAQGKGAKAPLAEAFGRWANFKLVLIALFGAVAGQAVVWYAGQFYALFFLERTMRVDGATANIPVAIALALATPFFIVFGWLSDRIGRKPIILAGCALAALTFFPLFDALAKASNPALHAAQAASPLRVVADPEDCSLQFDPVGRNKFDAHSCDVVKSFLARSGVSYSNEAAAAGAIAYLQLGGEALAAPDAAAMPAAEKAAAITAFQTQARAQLTQAGYPEKADPAAVDRPLVVGILFLLVLYVTMVYGPIAALLVEIVSDPHPLHVDVSALSYRQWVVRRLSTDDVVRHRRRDRGHLFRAAVSDRDCGGDGGDRAVVPAGDASANAGGIEASASAHVEILNVAAEGRGLVDHLGEIFVQTVLEDVADRFSA